MFSKLFRNDYSLNVMNKIYTIGIGVLSTAFITRYLGIEYKGDYSYITQMVLVLTIVFNLGIHQSYSFFYRKNNGEVFEKYISVYLTQFILHILLALSLLPLIDNKIYIYILLLLPFSVINQQMESTMAIENIRLKIMLHMFLVTIRMLSFLVIFLTLDTSLLPPIVITILLHIFSVLVYIYYSKPDIKKIRFDKSFLLKVIKYSWVPMLTALLINLNYSADVFLLKYMGTSTELGLYSTALGIINYFWLLPDAFKEVLLSKFTKTNSNKSVLFSIKLSLFTIILLIIAFVIFGRFAISILYGEEFLGSYLVTVILSLGAISMVFYKMIGVVLLAEGKRWLYFFLLLTSVVINIIANMVFIPIFGMYGAAYSSVISYSVCGFSFLLSFLKDHNLKLKDAVWFNTSELTNLKKKIERK